MYLLWMQQNYFLCTSFLCGIIKDHEPVILVNMIELIGNTWRHVIKHMLSYPSPWLGRAKLVTMENILLELLHYCLKQGSPSSVLEGRCPCRV